MTTLSFYQKLSPHRRLTTRTAAQLTGLSMPSASMALQRLAKEGLATRVKSGAWLIGETARKPGALIAAAAHPYEAYLSGWSALRQHGRIQQFPETHFGVTLGRPAELSLADTRIRLHHIAPALFGGYAYDMAVDGLLASPEKALFDLAYFAAMNRRPVSSHLPETDLHGLRWRELQGWLRRIPTTRVRAAVAENLRRMREQNSADGEK